MPWGQCRDLTHFTSLSAMRGNRLGHLIGSLIESFVFFRAAGCKNEASYLYETGSLTWGRHHETSDERVTPSRRWVLYTVSVPRRDTLPLKAEAAEWHVKVTLESRCDSSLTFNLLRLNDWKTQGNVLSMYSIRLTDSHCSSVFNNTEIRSPISLCSEYI